MSVTTAKGGPGYVSHNYIINGAFDIWQRGTSFSAGAVAYSADRWVSGRASSAAGSTLSRSTDVPANFTYSSKMQRDSGNSATNALAYTHRFEGAGIELAGKEVTLSFYAKAGADFSDSDIRVTQFSSSADWSAISFATDGTFAGANPDFASNNTNISITTSWQRLTYTFTVDSTANSLLLAFRFTPTGTAGADDSFYITGVQLEAGSVATPFKRHAPDVGLEELACKRYYEEKAYVDFGYVMTGQAVSTSEVRGVLTYLPKRASPSVVVTTSLKALRADAATRSTSTGITFTNHSLNDCRIFLTGLASMVAGNASIITAENGTRFQISAEL